MTAKPKKVSVILTSYNHARFLRESIDSILAQTYSDFDLVIWDDGSTDDSWEIINSYSDHRIRAFISKVEQRGAPIRALISEVETGEYIAVHHSDDVWEPQKLEKQVAFLDDHPDIGAVFTWVKIIDQNSLPFGDEAHYYYKIFEQPNRSRFEWLNYFFYNGNALCHPSLLIRKQCYGDCGLYRLGFAQLADFDMWVRLCLKYEIYVLPEKLVRFRVLDGEGNTSGSRPDVYVRSQFEYLQVYSNYLSITNPVEFAQVFPDTSKYFEKEEFDIPFALAMTSLDSPHTFAKLFGLQLLFNMVNDPEYAQKIERLYGFRKFDLFNLTAKYDIFSLITTSTLKRTLFEKDVENQKLIVQLNEITTSKAWRFALFIRRIRVFLIPTGSWRAYLLRRILFFLMFPFTLVHRSIHGKSS